VKCRVIKSCAALAQNTPFLIDVIDQTAQHNNIGFVFDERVLQAEPIGQHQIVGIDARDPFGRATPDVSSALQLVYVNLTL